MRLNIYDSEEKLSEGLASWMCDLIASTLERQEFFTLALSGGEYSPGTLQNARLRGVQ